MEPRKSVTDGNVPRRSHTLKATLSYSPCPGSARRPHRRPLEGLRRSVSCVVGHARSICPRESARRARRRVGAAHLGTKPVTPPAHPLRRRWRRLGRPTQGVHQGSKPAISVFGASNVKGISRQNARRPPQTWAPRRQRRYADPDSVKSSDSGMGGMRIPAIVNTQIGPS